MRGVYFFADAGFADIFFATENGGNWSYQEWANSPIPTPRLVGFGEDEDGELYGVDFGGTVRRFESASSIFTDGFESGDTSNWATN